MIECLDFCVLQHFLTSIGVFKEIFTKFKKSLDITNKIHTSSLLQMNQSYAKAVRELLEYFCTKVMGARNFCVCWGASNQFECCVREVYVVCMNIHSKS